MKKEKIFNEFLVYVCMFILQGLKKGCFQRKKTQYNSK